VKVAYLALAACLIYQPVVAKNKADPQHDSLHDESQLIEHGSYLNRDGITVHSQRIQNPKARPQNVETAPTVSASTVEAHARATET
jgi:hypothetical protein